MKLSWDKVARCYRKDDGQCVLLVLEPNRVKQRICPFKTLSVFHCPFHVIERAETDVKIFRYELLQDLRLTNPVFEVSRRQMVSCHHLVSIKKWKTSSLANHYLNDLYLGRFCPLETGTGDALGTDLFLVPEAKRLKEIQTPCSECLASQEECFSIGLHVVDRDHNRVALHVGEEIGAWIAERWPTGEEKVWARRLQLVGDKLKVCYDLKTKQEISYALENPWQILGFTARLIPFIQHDHPVRAAMAVKMLKQALPVIKGEPPIIQTGHESKILNQAYIWKFFTQFTYKQLSKRGFLEVDNMAILPTNEPGNPAFVITAPSDKTAKVELKNILGVCETNQGSIFAPGVNLLTAFIPFKGYNFSDSFVISKSAAEKLTTLHVYRVPVRGKMVVKVGSTVFGGQPLDEWGRYVVPRYVDCGKVIRVDEEEVWVLEAKPLKVGDKITNRHGNKGVIGLILPDDKMPYFKVNGQKYTVELLINPLSVIPRMNLGQLLELHWSWVLKWLQEYDRIAYEKYQYVGSPFGDSHIELLKSYLKQAGLSEDGKTELYMYDKNRGEIKFAYPVAVGYQYILKLYNLADHSWKVIGKSGPVDLLTGQPVEGQRLDEYEVWGLLAHGALHTLQELLTALSDDQEAKEKLAFGKSLPPSSGYRSLKCLLDLAKACGVDIRSERGKICIKFENPNEIVRDAKEVKSHAISSIDEDGLYSLEIFGDGNVRYDRNAWGFLQLPFVLTYGDLRALLSTGKTEKQNEFSGTEKQSKRTTEPSPIVLKLLPIPPVLYRLLPARGDVEDWCEFYARKIRGHLGEVEDLWLAYGRLMFDLTGGVKNHTAQKVPKRKMQNSEMESSEDRERLMQDLRDVFLQLEKKLSATKFEGAGILWKLAGKRTFNSGRAVIVPAPDLFPDHCYLPWEILLPFIIESFSSAEFKAYLDPINALKRALSKASDATERRQLIQVLCDSLNYVVDEFDLRVLLNRDPALHRYNILAFKPRAWRHRAIGVHPIVCEPFGADFDGDSMSIFFPISKESQNECRTILNLFNVRNLVSSATHSLTIPPVHEMLFHLDREEFQNEVLNEHEDKKSEHVRNRCLQAFEEATCLGTSLSFFDFAPLIVDKEKVRNSECMRSEIEEKLEKEANNPISRIFQKKVRGKLVQLEQMVGGYPSERVVSEDGEKLSSSPICANFYTGLSPFEYFMICHSARRSFIAKELEIRKSGTLLRKLVECAYPIRITKDNCNSQANIRTPLTCRELKNHGICQKCYGVDPTTGAVPELGSFVGIIAAQSIGERCSQALFEATHYGGQEIFDIGKINQMIFGSKLKNIEDIQNVIDKLTNLNWFKNIDRKHFEVIFASMIKDEAVLKFPRILENRGPLAYVSYADSLARLWRVAAKSACDECRDPKVWVIAGSILEPGRCAEVFQKARDASVPEKEIEVMPSAEEPYEIEDEDEIIELFEPTATQFQYTLIIDFPQNIKVYFDSDGKPKLQEGRGKLVEKWLQYMVNAVAIEEWRSYSSARRLAKALEKRLQSFIEEQFKIQVRVHLPRSGLKNVLQAMAMEIKGRAGRPRLEGTAILQRLYEQAFEEGKIKPEATPADVREILLKEAESLPQEEKQIVEQLLNSHWFAVRKRISGWQNAKKNKTLRDRG
jgi:hypothetical protein